MLSDRAQDSLAIKYHQLNGEICIQQSLVTLNLTQVFENTNPTPLEVEYSVPLPKNAVLISLKAIFTNGTLVECGITEKESARKKYQDKFAKGHNPILATQNTEVLDIFIGALPANEFIDIRLVYTYPLTTKEDYWKFDLLQGFLLNSELKHFFILSVSADSNIIEWNSNWKFEFEHKENTLNGIYDSQVKGYNKENLEFVFKSLDSVRPKCVVQKLEENYAVMMAFIPYCEQGEDIDDYEGVGEFVFILDRSGSMSGPRIELAKQAATLFIKSLSSKSKFNIVSFGSNCEFLFPESFIAKSENVNKAISLVNSFSADMGGTEIYRPLEKVFSQQPSPGLPKYAFLLTDGDVSSPEEVLDLILRNNKNCKVFSFGIEEANQNLIQGAAKNGNGESYIIHSADDIGKYVIDALGNCFAPFICDAKINWDCEFVPPLENNLNVRFGKMFCVYTVVSQLPEKSPVFRYFDSLKNRELNFSIDSFKFIAGDEIFKLWAKQKIETKCEKTLELSLKYQVISPLTAYFGCKINQKNVEFEIMPSILQSERKKLSDYDYAEFDECERDIVYANFICEDAEMSDPEVQYSSNRCIAEIEDREYSSNRGFIKCEEESENTELFYQSEKESFSISGTSKLATGSAEVKENFYIQIVLIQSTEGYWELEELIKIINPDQKILSITTLCENSNVAATALGLAYLNQYCESKKNEWVLIEKKL